MPRHSAEFGSALPGIAELKPLADKTPESKAVKHREKTLSERAQLMWDVYQDIKTAWVDFVRTKRSGKRKEDIDSIYAGAEQSGEVSSEHVELLRLVLPRLRDNDNPLSQEFRATPKFQKLHSRLAELWSDKPTQDAWRGEMQKEAGQWAEVNGSWEKYLGKKIEERELENQYDALMQEKFDERGKPPAKRRRTLVSDIADAEMALADVRAKIKELRGTNSELAAKILADELRERRRELTAKERFMIFPSRQEIIEEAERIATSGTTKRAISLVGESGTGKTSIARIIAKKLTGHDLLYKKGVTITNTTKVGRELFADKDLKAKDGATESPAQYGPVLYALTGKLSASANPEHDGRALLLDEVNNLSNAEGGKLFTELDSMDIGAITGYSGQGANPSDALQPNGLIITAENPATKRFQERTAFSTEINRKREKIPVPPLRQTPGEPELYESFLVFLQDAEGRLRANKEEVAPAWVPTEDVLKKTKQDRLNADPAKGGALWRLAQMLHESYENLAHHSNALTNANPDEWLDGRVLSYGDVYQWLEEYKKEVNKGVSLDHFISGKIIKWLETSFQDTKDAGDKLLYYKLAKEFALAAKETNPDGSEKADGAFIALPAKKITPNFLTEKEVAELSPRVPRKITSDGAKELSKPAEFFRITFDGRDESGKKYKKVEARIDKIEAGAKYVKKGTETTVYLAIGVIKKCAKHSDLIGFTLLAEEAKPEKKLVVSTLAGFEKKEPEVGKFNFNEQEAKRLGLETLQLESYPEADKLIARILLKPNESGFIDIANPAGQDKFCEEWSRLVPVLPPPCVPREAIWEQMNVFKNKKYPENITKTDGNFWFLNQLKANKIITNLTNKLKPDGAKMPNIPAVLRFGEPEFLLVDSWKEKDHDASDAAAAHVSALLEQILGGASTVNVKRETVDAALWLGDPAERKPSRKHLELLNKLGVDPSQYEFRCITQDEYARGSISRGWGQKQLWTNFDHYFLGDADRFGLAGGFRSYGGAANVDGRWRDYANSSLAVRLVLSRKR